MSSTGLTPARSRRRRLEQAQSDGQIRGDLPAERIAQVIFAALVGLDELAPAFGGIGGTTDDLLELLVSGLQTPSTTNGGETYRTVVPPIEPFSSWSRSIAGATYVR